MPMPVPTMVPMAVHVAVRMMHMAAMRVVRRAACHELSGFHYSGGLCRGGSWCHLRGVSGCDQKTQGENTECDATKHGGLLSIKARRHRPQKRGEFRDRCADEAILAEAG
jgi:hypothetical protein